MDCKAFLYAWCRKKKLTPQYEIQASGPQHEQIFHCEIRVDGIPYVGTGSSTTKREAQMNGARDFINHLVKSGEVAPENVPKDITPKTDIKPISQSNPEKEGETEDQKPETQGGVDSENTEQASTESKGANENSKKPPQQKRKVQEIQNPHGNWTIDNAKSKLHQYFQVNNITANYIYKSVGPDHTRRFRCQLTIHVPELGRNVIGRAAASNKLMASKTCALSIIRQLYYHGVIEAYSCTLRKDRTASGIMKSYPVAINPALEEKLKETLEELGITPVEVGEAPAEAGVTLLQLDRAKAMREAKATPGGVVSWSPPQPNWNTWTGCNIEEGPFFTENLDNISADLEKKHQDVRQNNTIYQEILREREQLPIHAVRSQIMKAINDNPVVMIRGSTGCGKTTQVCQFILDDYIASGQGAWANVCVTQPRRISAVSVAERVAHERCEDVGNSVGYSVRFDSVLPRPYGSVLFCTGDMLVRNLENGLKGVSHIIVDEVHERDAATDFASIILRDMVKANPDLRIILMSSAVDTSLFVKYFDDCPVVEIPAPTYPVTQYFLEDFIEISKFIPPPIIRKRKASGKKIFKVDDGDEEEELDEHDEDLNKNCNLGEEYSPATKEGLGNLSEKDMSFELIDEILKYISTLENKGTVLVFLPGWNLIFALMKHLSQHPLFGDTSKYMVLPLFSQISKEDHRKVFVKPPEGITKVVLSTNMAEASTAINDVVYVIDSCKIKIRLFNSSNNMTSYATVWASKTNLEQRKGRAGRVRPGVCFTLCSRARYSKLDEHLTAEMFRTPLHELGLSIKLLRLGAIGHFLSKAPEPPPLDAVIEAEALLRELGCLDAHDALTPLGTILAKLPIEPRLGKMMLLGFVLGVGDTLATMAANATTLTDVFMVGGRRRLAPPQRSLAGDRASDHVAMLNAYQMWENERIKGKEAEEEWCKSIGIERSTMQIIAEAKSQLTNIMTKQVGFPQECCTPQQWSTTGPDPTLDVIIALMCMGLYPNVCIHRGKREVLTPESKPALIDKPSVNCRSNEQKFPSPLFVFGEKLRLRAISCKQTTMVAPLHLLLFGSSKVEWVDEVVRLDNWLNFKMSARSAALVTALRPALEQLVERAAAEPDATLNFSPQEQKVISCLRDLCVMDAGDYNIRREVLRKPQQKNENDLDSELNAKKAKPNQNKGTKKNEILDDDLGDDNDTGNGYDKTGSGNKRRSFAKHRGRGNRRGIRQRGGNWNRGGVQKSSGYDYRKVLSNRLGYFNRVYGNRGGNENRGFGNLGYGNRGFRSRGGYGRGNYDNYRGYGNDDGYSNDGGYGNVGYGNDVGYGYDHWYCNDVGYGNDSGFYNQGVYNKGFGEQRRFKNRRGNGNQNNSGNRSSNYQSEQTNDWPDEVHEW